MENEKKIVGRCPMCGGNVVKTCKGYRCENVLGDNPTCQLNINALLGNRKMTDEEISELLTNRRMLLDGFVSKEGKAFSTVIVLSDSGSVDMQPVIAKCPHCDGEIRMSNRAFNCTNFANEANKCSFSIWRNIGGHLLTLSEAQEICEKGITSNEVEMFREDGSIYRKRLGLSPDKLQVVKI